MADGNLLVVLQPAILLRESYAMSGGTNAACGTVHLVRALMQTMLLCGVRLCCYAVLSRLCCYAVLSRLCCYQANTEGMLSFISPTGIVLRGCYAMCGTGLGYGATLGDYVDSVMGY
eukprot:3611831-Rhodomonas_salina.1